MSNFRSQVFVVTGRFAVIALLAAASAWPIQPPVQVGPQQKPAKGAEAVDAVELMKAVGANQKHIEEVRKDYILRRRDEERTYNSQGRLKSNEVREYEVYYLGPWEIDRLLSKNGKPVRDSKKQDEDVQKQEADARKRIARQESGEGPEKDEITLAKFLAADRFYNLRRENYERPEAYAIDFEPRPDFHPHSLVEKVLKSLGGTLWIDEQARQAVRLEAHFLESLKVGGGVLGAVEKGGNVVLEQRFVNDEVWMPSYLEIHLNARLLFLHKPINLISTYSDYRKFRVNSKITMQR